MEWEQMLKDWQDGDAQDAMYDLDAGLLITKNEQLEECWSIYNEFLRPIGSNDH